LLTHLFADDAIAAAALGSIWPAQLIRRASGRAPPSHTQPHDPDFGTLAGLLAAGRRLATAATDSHVQFHLKKVIS